MTSGFLFFSTDRGGHPLPMAGMTRDQRLLAFEYATETRRFEIERFWQRSLFFWGFLAVAFVGYSQLDKAGDWQARILVGCFGSVASLAWTLQNRGAKYWQEAWEQKVAALEMSVLGTRSFRHTEKVELAGWFGASRYSVSRLTIMLSDFVTLVWIALVLRLIGWVPDCQNGDRWVAAALVGTIGFGTLMLVKGRSEAGGKQRT